MTELYVNNTLLDTYEDGLGIRLNNKLNDPTKLTFTQSEFSFTFELPMTKTNNKAFNHINVPSVRNKFNKRYNATLYADGMTLFEGILKITGIEDDSYQCNLYTPKKDTLDEVFGDTKMNEFNWFVPFDGISTINEVNADNNAKYCFPLISYGLFQKEPEKQDAAGYKYYTDKYTVDNTNHFYYNSFIPSLNLVELTKRLFQSKGYTLQGDITTNPILNDIFLSNYINDEQDPQYNLANQDMGTIALDINFNTYNSTRKSYATKSQVYNLNTTLDDNPTYTELVCFNLLDTDKNPYHLTLSDTTSKMLIEDGIQIPSDGWYEISSTYTMYVDTYHDSNKITVNTNEEGTEQKQILYSLDDMPIEWQLLKYDADDGDVTAISHEPVFNGQFNEADNVNTNDSPRSSQQKQYYTNIPKNKIHTAYPCITAVDDNHNHNYIQGGALSKYATTIGYIKNGKSYDVTNTTTNRHLYNCKAYYKNTGTSGQTQTTDVNKNTLNNYTQYNPTYNSTNNLSSGQTHSIIYLHKNDILIPFFQQRKYMYTTQTTNPRTSYAYYRSTIDLHLEIKAVAKENTQQSKLMAFMTSNFDSQLNLANFCNNNQKMSDFVNSVLKAFNLSVSKNNKNISINLLNRNHLTSGFIDCEAFGMSDCSYGSLDFPTSMTCRFKVNEDEEGFYRSAEDNSTDEQLQSNNWKDYADRGYDTIPFIDTNDNEPLENTVDFSYNWYRPFIINDTTVNLPVIGKSEWYIEGYNYEEYQQYDGRGLTQRMFYKGDLRSDITLSVHNDTAYTLLTCTDYKNGVYLNYKKGTNTLLKHFFNVNPMIDKDTVEMKCYLSSMDYNRLTKGANVKHNGALHLPLEIKGYDPDGINLTTLILLPL